MDVGRRIRRVGRGRNGVRGRMVPSAGTDNGTIGLRVLHHSWHVPFGSRSRKRRCGTVGRTLPMGRRGDDGTAPGFVVSGGFGTDFLLQPPSSVELRPL